MPLSIVEVVRSPELINDVDISTAQLVALKAAYGLPLGGAEELELYRRATEKTEYVPAERREDVFVCGRRSGKDDKICANIAIYEGAFRQRNLSRGERGYVLLLAATAAQARICSGYILGKMQSSPILAAMIAGAPSDGEIELVNGITLAVLPANFRTIRGRSVVCAICSEIAFWYDLETNANPAREILRALRPSMATFKNAKLVMASSPWAKTGVLWEMYQKRHSWFGSRLVWRLDSLTMNPSLDRDLLREEEESDFESYQREYLATFYDSASGWVPGEAIEASIVRGRGELMPSGSHRYVAAIDAAFRNDAFAFAVVHREGDVITQDVTRSWRGSRAKPVNLAATIEEITATLKWYGVGTIFGDQFCSEPIRQAFAARGVKFEQRQTLGSRAGCFNSLRTLITSGKILLIDDAATIAELKSLQLVVTAGGNSRVEASASGHDDRAVALALAAHECISKPPRKGPPRLHFLDLRGGPDDGWGPPSDREAGSSVSDSSERGWTKIC